MSKEIINELEQIFSQQIKLTRINDNIENDQIPKGNNAYLLNCSVLFLDLRGSSMLSAKIQKMNMTKVYKSITRLVVASAEKYKGEVKQIIGDGFLIIFASDNKKSGQNALNAAVDINTDIHRFLLPTMKKYGILEDIFAGFGIKTGEVIFAKVGRRGKNKVHSPVFPSDVTNYASKFCSNAKEKEIIVDETTFHQLSETDKEHFKKSTFLDQIVYSAIDLKWSE